jgi:hypothetical protein
MLRPTSPAVLLLLAALLLALPGSAFAQSAGDEQYTDPFAEQDQAPAEQQPEQPAAPPSGTAEPSPGEGGGGEAAAAPAEEAGAAQPESPTLPRTGAPVLLLAAAGYALLLGGFAIRRQV